MDDKNVVKKRVTLAIAFAVFVVVVIAVILLIKPVMSKVQENRTAKVSQETAQEAEEFLKTKYPEVVIEKCEMYVKEHKPQENTQYISSKSIDTEYSYASYVFYGTMDTPDAKGDSVIIYMSDSGKSPYYAVKDGTNKDDAKWQMSIVQNKSGNAKTWDYAIIGIYLLIINVVTFALYGIDKWKAIHNKWRIREATLLITALIGGSLGAFIAMQMFRHKTKKWYFKYTVPAMLVVHVVGMILLVVKL